MPEPNQKLVEPGSDEANEPELDEDDPGLDVLKLSPTFLTALQKALKERKPDRHKGRLLVSELGQFLDSYLEWISERLSPDEPICQLWAELCTYCVCALEHIIEKGDGSSIVNEKLYLARLDEQKIYKMLSVLLLHWVLWEIEVERKRGQLLGRGPASGSPNSELRIVSRSSKEPHTSVVSGNAADADADADAGADSLAETSVSKKERSMSFLVTSAALCPAPEDVPVPEPTFAIWDDQFADDQYVDYHVALINRIALYCDLMFKIASSLTESFDPGFAIKHARCLRLWATWEYEGLHQRTPNEEFRDVYLLYKRTCVLCWQAVSTSLEFEAPPLALIALNPEAPPAARIALNRNKTDEELAAESAGREGGGDSLVSLRASQSVRVRSASKLAPNWDDEVKENGSSTEPLPATRRRAISLTGDLQQAEVRSAMLLWAEALDGMVCTKELCQAVDVRDPPNQKMLAMVSKFMDCFISVGQIDGDLSLRPLIAFCLSPNAHVQIKARQQLKEIKNTASGELQRVAARNLEMMDSVIAAEEANMISWTESAIQDMPPDAARGFAHAGIPMDQVILNWNIIQLIMKFEYNCNLPRCFRKHKIEDHNALARRRHTEARVLRLKVEVAQEHMAQELFDSLQQVANPKERFMEWEVIGHGAFGEVFSAKRVRCGPNESPTVAIKVIPDSDMSSVRREILTMSAVQHPNLICLENFFQWQGSLLVVMELCDGGSLQHFIDSNKLSEADTAYISREVLNGLAYLAREKRIHRDMKPGNIFLHLSGDVKIGDLGLSVEYVEENIKSTLAGTPCYMPPEMIRGEGYDTQADVWSFGCMVIEMCDREPPHHRQSSFTAQYEIAVGPPPQLRDWTQWSPELVDFIARCLQKDPLQRSTAEQLLKHPFLDMAKDKEGVKKLFGHVFTRRALKAAGLF